MSVRLWVGIPLDLFRLSLFKVFLRDRGLRMNTSMSLCLPARRGPGLAPSLLFATTALKIAADLVAYLPYEANRPRRVSNGKRRSPKKMVAWGNLFALNTGCQASSKYTTAWVGLHGRIFPRFYSQHPTKVGYIRRLDS